MRRGGRMTSKRCGDISSVSSNCLPWRMPCHTRCTCFTFLHCVFSSEATRRKRIRRGGGMMSIRCSILKKKKKKILQISLVKLPTSKIHSKRTLDQEMRMDDDFHFWIFQNQPQRRKGGRMAIIHCGHIPNSARL